MWERLRPNLREVEAAVLELVGKEDRYQVNIQVFKKFKK